MAVPGQVSPDPHLPEQRLLRAGDRLQDYAEALLRGEITAYEYGDLAMAEINRRSAMDPLLPSGEVVAVPPGEVVAVPQAVSDVLPERRDRDRPIVLARTFVDGGICSTEFLRLVRDC